jgi:S1-C subfamily serine protease
VEDGRTLLEGEMRQFVGCLLAILFLLTSALAQSRPFSNDDVIQMVSLGLSDDVIVEKIRSASSTDFDTSVDGLRALKAAKVSDVVLKAMISPHGVASGANSGRVMDEMTTKFRQLQNGVVTVWSEFGHGTGFIISTDGLVLTNQHVVGPSQYLALQFDPHRKIPAELLAADAERDVAVLWCDLTPIPEAISLELAKQDELDPSLIEGEKVFTIGSPLNQQKIVTSGIASKIEKHAIISDVNINHGNSGGPLFNSRGQVVGITTFGDFTSRGGPGVSGILKIEEAMPIIAQARSKMASSTRPKAELLPVEPDDLFPIDAIKSTLLQEKFDTKPYFIGVGDFDVAVITPPLKYRAEKESEIRAAKEKGKRNRKSEVAVQDSFKPLDDLKNWEVYVGEYKPVLLIRATPKLRETGGSVFLRSLAAAGGAYNVPAKLRFKADFYKMKLECGSKEILPILPGKIAHVVDVRSGLVNATDATYEGFYEYPASSIEPSCGQVTLTLYGEKDPNKAFVKKLDAKSVARIFEDFEAYRSQRTSHSAH